MDRLQSFGQIRAVDSDNRRVTVIASTGSMARDGAIIEQRGWDLTTYERAPVVLWAHDDRSLPIARTVSHELSDDELVQTHEFATHARAQEVFEAVCGGFVHAVSVRWNPLKWEFRRIDGKEVLVFTRQELLETSYVPIPADTGAMVLRADGGAIDRSAFMPTPTPEPEPAPVAVEDSRARRLAAFAASLRDTNALLKGA